MEDIVDSAYITARSPSINSLGDISNVDTTGKGLGSAIVYNGTNWVVDQNAFLVVDCGVATFIDEDISDDCGTATSSYSTRDRVDCGSAYAA